MIPKLEVDGVSYSYHSLDGETLALDHISFDVSPGEFLAIVGPSGCGKSTLLSMLCGLTQPEGGTINIDGAPLTKSPSAIGYMLQKDHLFEWRNIFSNISLGLEIQKRLDEPARQELLEMMAAYGLAGFEYAKPSELSGGMRQRAALIRTLALKPDLLLLDEPFSALDYQTRLSVCDDISSIIRQTHKTAILEPMTCLRPSAWLTAFWSCLPVPAGSKKSCPLIFRKIAPAPWTAGTARNFPLTLIWYGRS